MLKKIQEYITLHTTVILSETYPSKTMAYYMHLFYSSTWFKSDDY